MQKMNRWMKRYPTLAEKIEFGTDLDKPERVWVDNKGIYKIRERIIQRRTKS